MHGGLFGEGVAQRAQSDGVLYQGICLVTRTRMSMSVSVSVSVFVSVSVSVGWHLFCGPCCTQIGTSMCWYLNRH